MAGRRDGPPHPQAVMFSAHYSAAYVIQNTEENPPVRATKEGVIAEGATAILVLLPDAEPLLDSVRRLAPELVRPLPAHVSLLYPGPAPTPDVLATVHGLAAALPDEVTLEEPLLGDDGFVGIAVPALETALTQLRHHYPQHIPYRGRFGEDPPAHLTLALGADTVGVRHILRELSDTLPVRSRVHGPHLVQRTSTRWRAVPPAR